MKSLPQIILIFAVALSSCSNTSSRSKQDQAVPKALQNDENSMEVVSSKRIAYGSLMENLYKDAVSKNPELGKLENQLDAFYDVKGDSLAKVEQYKARSVEFYNSAKSLADGIVDSALKKKFSAIIEASEKRYQSKTSNLNNLLKVVERNEVSITDYHALLKLAVTLPTIEKYQDQNLVDVTKTAIRVVNTTESLKNNTKGLALKNEKDRQ